MKRIESLIKKIEKWDGQDVRVLQPMVNNFIDAIEDEDEREQEEYLMRLRDICGGLSSGIFPDDLSNAFEFLAIDHTNTYLFRESRFDKWTINQFYDEDDEAAEG